MKITRKQLRIIIKEAIEPGSYAEKIISMIETDDISNIKQALNLVQSGILEDAPDDEKKYIAQMLFDMTIGWKNKPSKRIQTMRRDLDDYMADPDMDWVISHSKALKVEEQLDIDSKEWFARSKAVAELLDIDSYELTGDTGYKRTYDKFEDFYNQFYEAGIF